MKKTTRFLLSLLAIVFMSFSGYSQATDLIISEYIEGSNSNKALEVYNATGVTVDLTNYRYVRYNNGGTGSPSGTFYFVGTLADEAVYVVGDAAAFPDITNVSDTLHGITWYNGDDYIALEKFIVDTWTPIDVIGVLGVDPGSCWPVADETCGTQNNTLVRKPNICSPTTDWAASSGTNAADSQWIVYDENEFGYLGAHTSSCGGGPIPLAANFSADQTFVIAGTTVNFTDLTGGGESPYSYSWDFDGDGFEDANTANPSFQYNTAGTFTVALEVTDNLSAVDTETKTDYITVFVTTPVSDIATLRAGVIGEYYTLSNEVILTFQQSYRGQKYIEDASAAILIDDNGGIISTVYAIEDGIIGVTGTLGAYGGMMQFIPLIDPGAANSSGNTISPQTITLNDLTTNFDNYEAELVEIMDITFVDAAGTFSNGTKYHISDGSIPGGTLDSLFRTTFYGVDYIGGLIPAVTSIVGLPNSRNDGEYITSRSLADFTTASNPATQLAVTLVNNGIDPYTSTNFEVIVQTHDADGLPANVNGDVHFTFTTNGGDLGTVDFVGSTTISGTILDGTFEVTVSGVQMAPEGTNVNITASDDVTFGLFIGTSELFDVIDFTLPAIIITEIMQNPDSVGDSDGEWFEVYNNSSSDIDMNGWTIKDDGSNSHVIASSLIVPAYGFAVLGNKADPNINGGYTCDYEYSGFTLANGDDEVILIDGFNEVDRVEYDGGSVWPDPHGASMVFTGFVDEDNNDGTKWARSALRESTYPSDPADDKGSPGTNGYSQIFDGGFKLDLKVFLEGAFNHATNSMENGLRSAGVMPYDQPFNPTLPYYGNNTPTWLYSGNEILSNVQYFAIDWLLIELRDGSSATSATMVAQYPAFVMEDGTVVSLNGTHALNINHIFINDMYVVVWHRNHLGIMNPTGLNPVFGTTESYDFSTSSSQVYGGSAGYTELSSGIWGMVSGDSNGDQVVNDTDKTAAWNTEAGEAGYKGYDLNLDGEINNVDKNDFWVPNNPTNSQVPN